jgi:hypothetical protein
MKKVYKTPLTEVVVLDINAILQDETGKDQDSTGTVPGDSPIIQGNESFFDEEEAGQAKSLWD